MTKLEEIRERCLQYRIRRDRRVGVNGNSNRIAEDRAWLLTEVSVMMEAYRQLREKDAEKAREIIRLRSQVKDAHWTAACAVSQSGVGMCTCEVCQE
jgi:hypothetical protein